VQIRHRDTAASVDPAAYIAPTAVLSGDVRVGPGSCVLHGAVLTADGGPVRVGANCVVMEQAVLRGTPAYPLLVGEHVLIAPHAYLTGCDIAHQGFNATGAVIFNGARMGGASRVARGGGVHSAGVVAPQTAIPIGWVAVGDPARMYPPGEVEQIRAGLAEAGGFLPFVFGTDRAAGREEQMRTALSRYSRALARHHASDEEVAGGSSSPPRRAARTPSHATCPQMPAAQPG